MTRLEQLDSILHAHEQAYYILRIFFVCFAEQRNRSVAAMHSFGSELVMEGHAASKLCVGEKEDII